MTLVHNAWYVAAWPHEITTGALLSRTICNEAMVFWRVAADAITALEGSLCAPWATVGDGIPRRWRRALPIPWATIWPRRALQRGSRARCHTGQSERATISGYRTLRLRMQVYGPGIRRVRAQEQFPTATRITTDRICRWKAVSRTSKRATNCSSTTYWTSHTCRTFHPSTLGNQAVFRKSAGDRR